MLTVRVEFAFPPAGMETLVGVSDGVIPLLGEAVAERLTVPAKPLMLAIVITEEPHVDGEI